MSPRTIAEALLVIAASIVLIFAVAEHNERLKAEAQQAILKQDAEDARLEAARSDADAEAALGVAQAAEAALRASRDSVAALQDSLTLVVEAGAVVVDRTVSNLTGIYAELRRIVPPEALLLVDRAEAGSNELAAVARTAQDAFRDQSAAVAALEIRTDAALAAKDLAISEALAAASEWQAAFGTMELRALNAEALMTEGILSRIKGGIPFLSVGGTTGALIGAGITFLATR